MKAVALFFTLSCSAMHFCVSAGDKADRLVERAANSVEADRRERLERSRPVQNRAKHSDAAVQNFDALKAFSNLSREKQVITNNKQRFEQSDVLYRRATDLNKIGLARCQLRPLQTFPHRFTADRRAQHTELREAVRDICR